MKRLLKNTNLIIIMILFVFSRAHSKEEVKPEVLKNMRGQAGVEFALGEIFIKVKYGEISYTDTDGYGTMTKAGIKVKYDGEVTTLKFKPIKKHEDYSKEKLHEIFGPEIGEIGLKEASDDNSNDSDELENLIIPISKLGINIEDICTNLSAIQLFNTNLLNKAIKNPALKIPHEQTKVGGIQVSLPSVESQFGGRKNDIIVFNAESPNGVKNNNKILLTIEWGESKTAILGGKIEITPNE